MLGAIDKGFIPDNISSEQVKTGDIRLVGASRRTFFPKLMQGDEAVVTNSDGDAGRCSVLQINIPLLYRTWSESRCEIRAAFSCIGTFEE